VVRGASFGSSGETELLRLEADAQGASYLQGRVDGEVDFGGGALTGTGTTFIAKLSADGGFEWSRLLANHAAADPGPFSVNDIAPTHDGALLVAGTFQLELNLGAAGVVTSAGANDVFVARFDDAGNAWTRRIGTATAEHLQEMQVDSAGNIWLLGQYGADPITVGGTPIGAPSRLFVLRLDSDGNPVWGDAPGDGQVLPGRIAVSEFGYALTGTLVDSATFGSQVALLPPAATEGATYIAVADSAGSYLWAGGYGEGGSVTTRAIDLTSSGGLAFAAGLNGAIRLGDEADGAELLGAVQTDAVVGRLDGSGTHQWSAVYGGVQDQTAYTIAHSDGDSALLLAGYVQGSIDLGGGARELAGQEGHYVAKIGLTGEHICSFAYAQDAIVDSFAAAPLPDDGFIVGGTYAGELSPGGGVELQSASTRNAFVVWYGP
jgi:hypothetical protein